MRESKWTIWWNWKMERCNTYVDVSAAQDVASMERAASNTKTWLFSAYSAKRFCFEVQFQFSIYNKVCHQVFWRSLPIQPLAIRLAILKKVQWSNGRTCEFRGNSFSSLLSFTFTPTFQVLMLQKLLLLFSKVQTQALVLPLYFSLSLR